jgi:phage-related protein
MYMYKFLDGASAEENRDERSQVQGSSLKDLCEFPKDVRREAGYQLGRVQNGLEPEDFKPMSDVGSGVQEIRIKDEAGIFRVLYVAKLEDAVYVLHCFQKKTQRTAKSDLDLASKRYSELVKEKSDER